MRKAFTLVELLVVIGIIALLISILMPALSKVRQQAVLVDCAARMRTMGQALAMYANENQNYLPADNFNYPQTLGTGQWHISATISRVLGHPKAQFTDLNPIFQDGDCPQSSLAGQKCTMNYNFHARLFPDWTTSGMFDPSKGTPLPLMRLTKVPRQTEIVAAFDGTPVMDNNWCYNNACFFSMHVQTVSASGVWWATNGFDSNTGWNPWLYPQPIVTGTPAAALGSVDFRHMGRKSANVLMLDGHVETRKIGTDLLVKDFVFGWR